MKKYIIQDSEAGNIIAIFDTENEAKKGLSEYEETDKKDGIYIPGFYEIKETEHPQPEEQVKEVDILKEDYNILNYKYAECIKVNTGLKEVNKILVDALLDIINEIEPIPINGKDSQTITEYLVLSKAKEALKEANLIK